MYRLSVSRQRELYSFLAGSSNFADFRPSCLDRSMTSAGYVGEDVESAVARLVEEAGGDVEKASRGIIFIDEIDKISASDRGSKDVGGTGVQQALLKMLEGTMVNVSDYNVVEGSNSRGLLGMIKKGPSRDQSVDTTNILFIVAGALYVLFLSR